MNGFYEHHKASIQFHYRCFDRLLLNATIQSFQQPERVVGFFNTFRQLSPVSREVLRDIATQYHHWERARIHFMYNGTWCTILEDKRREFVPRRMQWECLTRSQDASGDAGARRSLRFIGMTNCRTPSVCR